MNLSNYERMNVKSVSLSKMGFVVLLCRDNCDQVLPIFIGASEAHSISAALHKQPVPRPLSHDLFKNILNKLNCQIKYVLITKLEDDTFYSELFIQTEEKVIIVDSRPSDAITLALREKAPLYVHQSIIESSLVPIPEDTEKKKNITYKNQLEVYEDAMSKAISEERYEDAANLRDQIKFISK